jgi:crotonobetainyl-CoA:carnitine CoA-transferase CaiB-like acyl-CoA transferase
MSRSAAAAKSPAPLPSADTDEVLAELGYADPEIAQLHAEHVV